MNRNASRPLSGTALGRLAASAALVCAGALATTPALALDKVTFLTNWYAQAEHGGFYAALANGIYEKHGLDVTIRMGGPQVNVMQLLAARQAEFIMGYDIGVMKAVEQGIPAVTVGVSFQKDLQGILAHKDVTSLEQLQDKNILIATSTRATWWPWLKKAYGLSEEQARPYTFNIQPFVVDSNAVQQGYMSSEPFQLQQQGIDINYFLLADHGWPPYGNTIVAHRAVVEENPDLVRRFVRASMEGWKQYLDDPSAANALIKADNPNMTDEQLAYALQRFQETGVLAGGDAAERGIGAMSAERYREIHEFLVEAELLDPSVDYTRAFTTEFVDDLRVMP